MSDYKAIVIGAGPAGYTAAIYLGRANIPHILFEGDQPGGQLTITTDVENFPAFPEGVEGPELMVKMKAQAERFGTRFHSETVTAVDFSGEMKKVITSKATYEAPAVIIATGSTARWLGLENEQKFMGRGLSACATCDGFFFRDQDIAVVGGGDTALEEATYLTNFAKSVTLIHRRDELRGSKIMQERALSNPKITVAWNKVIDHYVGDEQGNLRALALKDTTNGEMSELPVTGCFIAIGHTPNTQFLDGVLKTDENGYLITKANVTATEIDGVFAAGDVQDHVYRQAITSAGTKAIIFCSCVKTGRYYR
ncbi:thioredoxin-disulfide reductase [bacterium DOLJORAL78_65_58]|nr:MAG: thioredoxin-disulfide reductase [bacterium DOLJORAL78_65_58]